MQGAVVLTGVDDLGNRTFGITMEGVVFPVKADDVLLRGLEPGDTAQFMTERETGRALILHPLKVRGCGHREAIE